MALMAISNCTLQTGDADSAMRLPKSLRHHRSRSSIEMAIISLSMFIALWWLTRFSLCLSPSCFKHPDVTGAVVSLDARCSRIGTNILKKGGNAADSAVAVQFCVGVIGMSLTGIAGGGFMLIRDRNGEYEFIDFRETAPAASNETMFDKDVNASVMGGLASGVPGELRGLEYLHTNFGSLPWADLVEPSVRLAQNGFLVEKDLVGQMDRVENQSLFLDPAWAPDFAPGGKRLRLGDWMTRRRYAETLEYLRTHGPASFYSGYIADTTVEAVQKAGGIISQQDFREYRVVKRPTYELEYNGYRIVGSSAPAGGSVGFSILNTMRGYFDAGAPEIYNLTLHRLVEAMRFGFGERTKLGDPDFSDLSDYQKAMMSDAWAAQRRLKIQDTHTLPTSDYNPDGIEILDTPGTSHISTADFSGMAVSLTSTVNLVFGSCLMVPETGIILNNEMNDFSIPNSTNAFGLKPSPANFPARGKRPLSSINPLFLEHASNRSLYAVLGAAGGSRIITATVQGVWNLVDRSMTLADAVADPRVHDQLSPNYVLVQSGFSRSTIASLEARGHNISFVTSGHGSDLHIIRRLPNGTFEAASEPRLVDSGGFAV